MKCGNRYCFLPVDVNGLQEAKRHPGPQEEDVVTEDHDSNEETSTEDDCLSRVSVLCLHAEGSLGKKRGGYMMKTCTLQCSLFPLFVSKVGQIGN